MKDEFTTCYSAFVQHQIELNASVEAILTKAKSVGVPAQQVEDVQEMIDAFNARLNCLATRLVTRFDDGDECTGA